MDPKLEQALTTLANTLGVTVSHLWSVLVRQAPISALVDLVMCALFITVLVVAGFFLRAKSKEIEAQAAKDGRSWCDEDAKIQMAFGWAILTGFSAIAFMVAWDTVSTAITALMNPEYLALKTVLKLL